ncbi:hypothetical protein BAJUN_00500 [Bajunvirus bajun]|uniref:Uncharacterized protein n=1 Tax=Brevundimonas phage vB_BgoS-Bajun TaxID=2948594 RepID=A0A9E7N646_9CAUD|nr:hypothetical protein BAJUN_00500 [Brevundimonas phage vB_BgoS-Bajun]
MPMLTHEAQLRWHDEWKGRVVATRVSPFFHYKPGDEVRYGVCLAVINGTYNSLAIVDLPENGPGEDRHVFDIDIQQLSRVDVTEGDTREERTILAVCLRDGEFKVRFQDDLYQPANRLHAAGLLRRGAIEKSPTGFTFYTLTQLGRATALMRGIRP